MFSHLQADVVLASREKQPFFSGFRDHGALLEDIASIYSEPATDSKMPDHVLQLINSGFTGFRFPLAHFPTRGMTALELENIIGRSVTALYKHNFQVKCRPYYITYQIVLTIGSEHRTAWQKSHHII